MHAHAKSAQLADMARMKGSGTAESPSYQAEPFNVTGPGRCDEVGPMEKLSPGVQFPDAALPHTNLYAASQARRSTDFSA